MPFAPVVDLVGDHLAQDEQAPLELVVGLDVLAAADEHLHVHRLGRQHRRAERGVVARHLAPAEQHLALARHHVGIDVEDHLAPLRVARQKNVADGVMAGLGQVDAELGGLAREELVRDLHQNAGAVAGPWVGADRAAVLEVEQDLERVVDDLVGFAALDVGDEADPAGILFQRRIVESARRAGGTQCRAGIRLLRLRSAGPIREACRPHGTLLSFRNARNRVSAHPPRPRRRWTPRCGRNPSS